MSRRDHSSGIPVLGATFKRLTLIGVCSECKSEDHTVGNCPHVIEQKLGRSTMHRPQLKRSGTYTANPKHSEQISKRGKRSSSIHCERITRLDGSIVYELTLEDGKKELVAPIASDNIVRMHVAGQESEHWGHMSRARSTHPTPSAAHPPRGLSRSPCVHDPTTSADYKPPRGLVSLSRSPCVHDPTTSADYKPPVTARSATGRS